MDSGLHLLSGYSEQTNPKVSQAVMRSPCDVCPASLAALQLTPACWSMLGCCRKVKLLKSFHACSAFGQVHRGPCADAASGGGISVAPAPLLSWFSQAPGVTASDCCILRAAEPFFLWRFQSLVAGLLFITQALRNFSQLWQGQCRPPFPPDLTAS